MRGLGSLDRVSRRTKLWRMVDTSRAESAKDHLAELFAREARGEPFRVEVLELDDVTAQEFVRMRTNPPHFYRKIFNGDWADPGKHPQPGPLRILRMMAGYDGVTRVIGRQGNHLFVTPWIA